MEWLIYKMIWQIDFLELLIKTYNYLLIDSLQIFIVFVALFNRFLLFVTYLISENLVNFIFIFLSHEFIITNCSNLKMGIYALSHIS